MIRRWPRELAWQFAQALPLSLIAAGLLLLNAVAPY